VAGFWRTFSTIAADGVATKIGDFGSVDFGTEMAAS